jgi:mono/diheme cytochrome c family protein
MKYVWRGLAIAGLTCVILAAVAGVYVWRTWDAVWDVPLPDIHASNDPAVIARGEYLVNGPSHCITCHAESEAVAVRGLENGDKVPLRGGQRFADRLLGEVYARNLTPDTETGIGRYSDGQIARLLRSAVKPDGRTTLQSLMPYGEMSDEDLTAVVSFLRAQPPVRNVVPPVRLTTIGKVVKSFAPAFRPRRVDNIRAASPPQAPTRERGEYLVRAVGNCGGCHTPYDPLTFAPTGPALSGGNDIAPAQLPGVDRALWFKPPNLTPMNGSALSKFPDRATFIARVQRGGRHYPGSPMPWESISRLTTEDAAAIYEYLRSLTPVPGRTGEPTFRKEG